MYTILCTGFCHYPAFGLGCDCVHWEFVGYKPSDILENVKCKNLC